MNFKSIKELENLEGKRVLLRVDWNVPLSDGVVVDDYRIEKSMKTIEYLGHQGAKMIIISHIESKEGNTLVPVFNHLKDRFPIHFCEEVTGPSVVEAVEKLEDGGMLLLENLRSHPGEKENSEDFARDLASFGDIYVNEAFSVSHRSDASIVGVPKFLESFGGLQFASEIENLSKAFSPKNPFLFILAGAKFDTKMPLLEKFLNIADKVFVGGALANNFFKEMNLEIGRSLVSEGNFHLNEKMATNKIIIPSDVLVKRGNNSHIVPLGGVQSEDIIVDVGPNTLLELEDVIRDSSTILWNGPLGNFEKGYRKYTLDLASFLAESGKEVIVGGGDTLAAIKELGLEAKFTFVSTAGGAMLDFLSAGTLPGIEAISNQ